MKRLLLTSISTFFVSMICVLTFAVDPPTVREQLETVNSYWKGREVSIPILNERVAFATDIERIQLHLELVEKNLRETDVSALSPAQRVNRKTCLDILHTYMEKGVFPMNICHTERTPYFIDHLGTACAVGHLIIETGHGELAKRISVENNFAYVRDLHYPELQHWANTYGFTLEELMWIQPGYDCQGGSCPNNTLRNVTCHGHNDGCIGLPATSLQQPPYVFQWEKYSAVNQSWAPIPEPCGLAAGTYRCIITDDDQNTEEHLFTLTQSDQIAVEFTVTNDSGPCDGAITMVISGGVPPYQWTWAGGDTAATMQDLCHDTYIVGIRDSLDCLFVTATEVGLVTSMEESISHGIEVHPNPSEGEFCIAFGQPLGGLVTVNDALGKEVVRNEFTDQKSLSISVPGNAGVYFLHFISDDLRIVRRIVKR
jgi:hypothetical protein